MTIDRRTILKGGLALGGAAALGGLVPNFLTRGGRAAADPGPRPNVVLIVTDDQRYDEMFVMPRTAAEIGGAGVDFGRMVLSRPLCGPSRASILSGQYVHNHGVVTNVDTMLAKYDAANTLPVWMQNAGYTTCLIGKYINFWYGTDAIPPGWSDWHAIGAGFSTAGPAYTKLTYDDNGVMNYVWPTYAVDADRQRAVTFLQAQAGATQPFFLYLCPVAPHKGANQTPKRYAKTPVTVQHLPSFNEADVSDKPAFVRKLPLLDATRIKVDVATETSRLRSLMAVDDLVGAVIDNLTAIGQLDNTVIFFTSDNGFMRGEHRIGAGKTVVYEESATVPLMVRNLPGTTAGTVRRDVLVANVDLAPTICALAGATPTHVVDGRNIIDLVAAPDPLRAVLIDGDVYDAARSLEWVYTEYPKTKEFELYNLFDDPYQMTNIASTTNLTPFKATLNKLRGCKGGTCVVEGVPTSTTTTTSTSTTTVPDTTTTVPDTTTTVPDTTTTVPDTTTTTG